MDTFANNFSHSSIALYPLRIYSTVNMTFANCQYNSSDSRQQFIRYIDYQIKLKQESGRMTRLLNEFFRGNQAICWCWKWSNAAVFGKLRSMAKNQWEIDIIVELSEIQCTRSSRKILFFLYEYWLAKSKVSAIINI